MATTHPSIPADWLESVTAIATLANKISGKGIYGDCVTKTLIKGILVDVINVWLQTTEDLITFIAGLGEESMINCPSPGSIAITIKKNYVLTIIVTIGLDVAPNEIIYTGYEYKVFDRDLDVNRLICDAING